VRCTLTFVHGAAINIVWLISTCASLSRGVLEFAFHRNLSPEREPFGKWNKSNWYRICDRGHRYFSFLHLKSRGGYVSDGVWSKSDQRVIIKFLLNERIDPYEITHRPQVQFRKDFKFIYPHRSLSPIKIEFSRPSLPSITQGSIKFVSALLLQAWKTWCSVLTSEKGWKSKYSLNSRH
jgi:hypothetical protein